MPGMPFIAGWGALVSQAPLRSPCIVIVISPSAELKVQAESCVVSVMVELPPPFISLGAGQDISKVLVSPLVCTLLTVQLPCIGGIFSGLAAA